MGLFGGIGSLVGGLLGGGGSNGPTGRVQYDKEREDAIKAKYAKLTSDLEGMQGPKALGAETGGYVAKNDVPGLAARAEAQKARATQGINAQAQNANDAIARRFAAMGAGGSGAAIKQTQQIFSDAQDKSIDAGNQIDEAANQERNQFMMNEANKEFQSGEAIKGRNASREQYNADSEFKDKVFRFDSKSKLAQLELGAIQAERDAQDQAFNKEMAQYQQQHSGGLLGAGGFLGLGIGI